MENNELTQNQIVVEIRRISKNIQFFFWLTIASIGFSLITAIYLSVETGGVATTDVKASDPQELEVEKRPVINRSM